MGVPKGFKHSAESKDKISEAARTRKRDPHTDEAKAKMSASQKLVHSQKTSESRKERDSTLARALQARWESPEQHELMSERMTERYADPVERIKTARATTLARSGRAISRTEFLHAICPVCGSDMPCLHKKSAWWWMLTIEEYAELFQSGCPCGLPLPVMRAETSIDQRVVVDHDHTHKCPPAPGRTRQGCRNCIRGLMHQNCNVALGMAGDSPEVLRKLADYLENPVTLDTQDHS